ncbi:hypothetical protein SK128_006760 [Halocaridina rubra]|uniref:Small integral membrane protein 13 n=1 Tax=Halocaridina rubra TaxID=373956 RepID=A0AAN8WWE4_HALRR
MDAKELFLGWFSLAASVIFVVLFVLLGWYIVWRLFLSRFKFIRELLGSQQEASPSVEELKQARSRASRKVRRD